MSLDTLGDVGNAGADQAPASSGQADQAHFTGDEVAFGVAVRPFEDGGLAVQGFLKQGSSFFGGQDAVGLIFGADLGRAGGQQLLARDAKETDGVLVGFGVQSGIGVNDDDGFRGEFAEQTGGGLGFTGGNQGVLGCSDLVGVLHGDGDLVGDGLQHFYVLNRQTTDDVVLDIQNAEQLLAEQDRHGGLGAGFGQQRIRQPAGFGRNIGDQHRLAGSSSAADKTTADGNFVAAGEHNATWLAGAAGHEQTLAGVVEQVDMDVVVVEGLLNVFDHRYNQFLHVQDGGEAAADIGAGGESLGALGDALFEAGDEIAQAGGHLVEGIGQDAEFVRRTNGSGGVQITSGDGLCCRGKALHRAGDPAGEEPQQNQPEEGQRQANGELAGNDGVRLAGYHGVGNVHADVPVDAGATEVNGSEDLQHLAIGADG